MNAAADKRNKGCCDSFYWAHTHFIGHDRWLVDGNEADIELRTELINKLSSLGERDELGFVELGLAALIERDSADCARCLRRIGPRRVESENNRAGLPVDDTHVVLRKAA